MKKMFKYLVCLIVISALVVFGIDLYVVFSTKDRIVNEYSELKDIDCIVVLGAGVYDDKPSPMLKDRLDTAVMLFNDGVSEKIIMSGDHMNENHDEVNVMKTYAVEEGINSSSILMDHAGISTYDSIYRVKNIFRAKRVVIVTQEYHLYRALYIAKSLGLESYGVSADTIRYSGQFIRDIREVLARDKDFVKTIFKPESKYLGEVIPVSVDGDITNDKDIYRK